MANDQKVEILQGGLPNSTTNPLFVAAGTTPGTQDSNLTQVAGVAVKTGAGTATGVIRVELPTNGTGVVGLNAGSAIIGNVRIDQTTPGTTNGVVPAGLTAADSPLTANPVTGGGLAASTDPTPVTAGDVVNELRDLRGRAIVNSVIRTRKGDQQTQISNSTAETTIVTASASTFNDLYGLILANTGASTTKVTIRDDTTGTIRAIIEVPTLETRGFMLPADAGFAQAVVNKPWTAQCTTATTALEVTALFAKTAG